MTPESGQALGGIPQEVLDTVIVAPVDIAAVDAILTNDDDIAAVNGVDMMGGRAFLVSSAHDEEVIDRTTAAFSQSLKDLRAEGEL